MINRLVTYLLDKVIGKYVDNFTSSNVKTGLFQGDIRMENLPLKKGVLEDITDCPINVKSGVIGRVTLRIPYTQLRTQPWAIMVEDIYIVAAPGFKRHISPEKEIENEIQATKLILDSLEAKWRKSINHQTEFTKAEDNSWVSSVASLGYRVLRNIQIEVRNVHIRYEDNETIPTQTFAVGLVIDEFSTKSSDFEWNSKNELKVDVNVVQKILDLKNIRLYLDPDCDGAYESLTPDTIKTMLKDKLASVRDVDFVVQPISIHGTMKRHLTPLPIYDQPRISLHLQMQQLEVSLTQKQYQTSIGLLNEFERHDRQMQHIKNRPQVSILESPRQWWQFSIKEHMSNVCKGETLSKRARDIVCYVQSYENHLLEKNNDVVCFFNQLEIELDLAVILSLREIAVERAKLRSIEMLKEVVSKPPPSQNGWLSYLWRTKTTEIPSPVSLKLNGDSETTQILEKLLPEDTSIGVLEQDISDILNEIDRDAANFFTKDKIFLRGHFLLSGIRIKLLKDVTNPIAGVQADNLSVGFESRPSYSSWSVRVALKSLLMQDLADTSLNSPFADVISGVNSGRSDDDRDIFMMAFEKNPLPMTSVPGVRKRLAVTSEPLTIIHCPRLINNVKQYFDSIISNHSIAAVAQKHIRNAKIRTRASLKEMLEKEAAIDKWHIFLKISAPKLILPNYCQSSHINTHCVVLDLGRLQVSNCDETDLDLLLYGPEKKCTTGDESDVDDDSFVTPATTPMGSMEDLTCIGDECSELSPGSGNDKVYEEYSVVLDNIMVLVGSWIELKTVLVRRCINKRTDIMLMEPFKFQLNVRRKYIRDNDSKHPNIILDTVISRLLINLSDTKILLAKGCLQSFAKHMTHKRQSRYKQRRYNKSFSEIFDTFNVDAKDDRQLLAATFVLHAMIVQLETENRPLVELTLTEAQFTVVQYRSKTSIDLALLSLIMADARANLGPNLDFIVASHRGAHISGRHGTSRQDIADDPLIVVSYEMKRRRSGYGDVEHGVNVAFSGLDIIANQETVMELLSFVQHSVVADDSVRVLGPLDNDWSTVSSSRTPFGHVDLCLTCRSVSVLFINIVSSVHLDEENRSAISIGTVSLDDMKVKMVLNDSSLQTTVTIRGISVHDLSTVDSLHRGILSLTTGTNEANLCSSTSTDNVIKITIDSKSSSDPISVTGTMPHFIYVHSAQFIDSVEHCVTAFQIYLTRFKNNLTAAARTAIFCSADKDNDFELLTRCRIHVAMLSPILVLPRHKTSRQVIIVHLGDVDILNDNTSMSLVFTDATVMSRSLPIIDQSYRIDICTETENVFFLLTKTNFSLKFMKVRSSTSDSFSGIDVHLSLCPSITASLSKDVYEQLLNSMDNIVYDEDDDVKDQVGDTLEINNRCTVAEKAMTDEEEADLYSQELAVRVHTNLAELKVELCSDTFVVSNDAMLRLTLRDMSIEFIRQNKYVKDIAVTIDYLSIYQILDSSQNKVYQPLLYCTHSQCAFSDAMRHISTSCPNVTDTDNFFSNLDFISTSLPRFVPKQRNRSSSHDDDIGYVPSSADRAAHNTDINVQREKFMQVKVQLIDRKHPDFLSTYDCINRFIDSSFTDLTCRITTDIWVILLDFFGLGSKFFDPDDIKQLTDVTKVLPSFNRRYDGEIEEIINKRLTVHMKEFELRLENEIKYPNFDNLAGMTVTNLVLNIDSMDGNMNLSGSVEDLQLVDLSPTGAIYPTRLFPASYQERLLEFQLFKYGLPDPSLLRAEDMRVMVKVNSPIVYVHTQRFLQELNQFVQNFFQYQDRLSHIRVTSAGRVVDKMAPRSARIRMTVSSQAPLLLIPVSAFSDHLLVADLGRFSLTNQFKFPDNDPTQCLLDEMCINLHHMDVYSALRISSVPLDTDLVFPSMVIRPLTPKPLSQTCNLHLTVSRNLDSNISHSSPDWLLKGTLSSVVCSLNIDQYRTIRGLLAHNFGENTDHLNIHRFQAFHVDPSLHTNLTGIVWLTMKFELYLHDVQLNLLSSINSVQSSSCCSTICRMNFQQSKLSFESFSDSSKTIELACQDIIVEDLRYQSYPVNNRPSVFPTVLSRDTTFSSDKDQSSCQLKIQYTSSKEINKFHVFLDTMKIITIFDWIKSSQTWIFTAPYEIISLGPGFDDTLFDDYARLYVQSIPHSKSVPVHPGAVREHYREIVKEDFKSTTISVEVQESRFFILENAHQSNSTALILTVAGSFSYQTREFQLGPFSCNIPRLHLASCSMASSSSNLLSIVNPVKIHVSSKENYPDSWMTEPSLDNVLQDSANSKLSVQVAISAFKVRLSFCDLQLVATILRSLPSQTTPPANVAHQIGSIRHKWSSITMTESTETSNSNQPLQRLSKFIDRVSLSHLKEHDFISICLIDDCIDADVPLFDIKLNSLKIDWHLGFIHEATMNTSLSMDYYNINSFGWTPIIEPWQLRFSWKFSDKIELQLISENILNIDVSSHLLQIARNTHKKWSAELAQGNFALERIKRDRTPFVPFVIVNQLGCPIKYAKLPIDKPPSYDEAVDADGHKRSETWYEVPDNVPQTLCFDRETTARDKIRYDRYGMHFNSSHRIELLIDGCSKCHPITVDKLGTFYRDLNVTNDKRWRHSHVRVIIDIVRHGTVQNQIIIRSALQLHNALNIPLQIRLYNNRSDPDQFIEVESLAKVAIPLYSVFHRIQVRPLCVPTSPSSPTVTNCLFNTPTDFSEDLINWKSVASNQRVDKEILCPAPKHLFYSKTTGTAVYLICTVEQLDSLSGTAGLPGHTITIGAPLTVENLLPCDLKFDTSLEDSDDGASKVTNCGIVQASEICTVLTSSMHQTTQLGIELDNFPRCNKLTIPGHAKLSHGVLMCLYDSENRKLELQVKVESRPSGPVHVTIYASYWIVNRTSLSLVYAQAGSLNHIAAGQSPENEKASSSMPFPFSFSNFETYQLVIRLGNKSKAANGDQLRPNWSPKLSLDKMGTATIQLKAALPDVNRPYLQYNIGLEIRPGKGVHRVTTMVILTARYLLDNRSSYQLNISQYKAVNKTYQDISISALPKSMLSFHWPRDDLDPLLSIQLLNSNKMPLSIWSGGFRIDQTSSFHVYLRGINEHSPTQIRVTVTLQGARFRVVFTDTDGLPPPYLLQNLTRLQLFFSQIVDETNNTKYILLAPNANVPYALDEPTQPPTVTLSLEGGSHSIYNLNTIGNANSLHYDNFLYLVVSPSSVEDDADHCQLVCDVQSNNRRVFLNYKKPGSRSQLWYYSSNCELFHEGSIAPHDPKGQINRSADNHYLLDVDLIAPTRSTNNQQKYQMILARADPRREKFQRWHFTEDGCLTNNLGMKCRAVSICQNAAVFSAFTAVERTVPLIMYRDWLRPGSGTVLVSILTQGPTRVLRIYDKENSSDLSVTKSILTDGISHSILQWDIMVHLKEVGVFLINHLPEELLYLACCDIEVEWNRRGDEGSDALQMDIRTIQCDNQLMDAGFPCFIYQDSANTSSSYSSKNLSASALSLRYQRELGHPYDVHVFNYIQAHLVPMTIILEEKLVLKVIQMLAPPSTGGRVGAAPTEREDFSQLLHYSDFHEGKKIYIGNLLVLTGTMCLSVITADSLTPDLKSIKKLIPYLMSFANAQIPIDPYNREHVFETSSLIGQGLFNHYHYQLRSQAIKIFGTVDFLGNPIGFISDITSGMKRFYSDQNVSGMIKHFAHGIGDSTAKICNSASRVVYGITLDPDYQKRRQLLLDEARISNSNSAHVKAGFRSFLNGIVGGVMSVPVQTLKGYQDDGSTGLFSGALKGMVGFVTKPVGGILDFATGSAASFREMARSSREGQPHRRCEPRCLSSSWKLLPFYSSYGNNLRHSVVLSDLSQAQILLAKFSKPTSPMENVVGLLVIKKECDSQMKILVSDSSIHVIKTVGGESTRIKNYKLSMLCTPPVSIQHSSKTIMNQSEPPSPCHCQEDTSMPVYIKFNCQFSGDHKQQHTNSGSTTMTTSGPTFKCDCVHVAKQVVKLVCEAQCDYLEREMTVTAAVCAVAGS